MSLKYFSEGPIIAIDIINNKGVVIVHNSKDLSRMVIIIANKAIDEQKNIVINNITKMFAINDFIILLFS